MSISLTEGRRIKAGPPALWQSPYWSAEPFASHPATQNDPARRYNSRLHLAAAGL